MASLSDLALNFNFTAMEADNLGGDGQPQPRTLLFNNLGVVRTIKFFKYVRRFFLGHAVAGIADIKNDHIVFFAQGELYFTVRGRIFYGVAQDVDQGALQQLLVPDQRGKVIRYIS